MSKTAKKFQILMKDERDETCNEMYRDTILQDSVYSFVSLSFLLIPEAGCGQSPRVLINTGFLDISGE